MTRRTFEQVRRETIVAERAGVLGFRRLHEQRVDQQVRAGKLDPDEAATLKQGLRAFADAIATGLHVQEPDPTGVRADMRANVVGGRSDG